MALVQYPRVPIEVPIANAIFEGTVVKRKAYFLRMTYNHDSVGGYIGNFGSDGVMLDLLIKLYAVSGSLEGGATGSYGEKLNSKIFSDYNQTIIADNRTYVNAETGDYICSVLEASVNPDLISGSNYMTENEFFHMMADNASIPVGPMIRSYITRANETGKFNL